jgi:hypothetical protein
MGFGALGVSLKKKKKRQKSDMVGIFVVCTRDRMDCSNVFWLPFFSSFFFSSDGGFVMHSK